MPSTLWLIACITLDVGVLFTNLCEQLMISIKWHAMNRIDHLLFSLSISDLICGLGALGADSWHFWNGTQHQGNTTSNMTSHQTNTTLYNYTISTSFTSSRDQPIIQSIFDLIFIFSLLASAFHVMYLAVERVCAIRFPGFYMMLIRFSFKFAILSVIWLVSFVITFTLKFTVSGKDTLNIVFGSILSIIMILVFTTNSAVAIFVRSATQQDINHMDTRHQQNRKCLATMCIFLGLSYFGCMLPITLGFFHNDHYHDLSNLMVTLNSLINPCIYFVTVYWDARVNKRAFPKLEQELMSMDIEDSHALVAKTVEF